MDIKHSGRYYERIGSSADQRNNSTPHPALNEIGVCVCRDETLLNAGAGKHRLSIARILGIDLAPVVVWTRHTKWQMTRDNLKYTKNTDNLSQEIIEYINYPDL